MQITEKLESANRAVTESSKRRSLIAACLAHGLHDGYTDALYAFLPVWQTQFGLSYAGLAVIRALYYATMGGLQVPGDRLVRNFSPRAALALSTAVAAAGFIVMVLPLGLAGLCVGLVIAGVGSSVQHPRASTLVSDAYAPTSRRALGVYNFSGDVGKATLPAIVALSLPFVGWQSLAGLMAVLGLAVMVALLATAPQNNSTRVHQLKIVERIPTRWGFTILMIIGAFDTATRMGYLLFLPFLIDARGGTSADIGIGLALLFIGGALGKATFSWIGERLGVIGSVVSAETVTALLIVATLLLPLVPMLILLPLLGIVLNGTSSLLYGTVPELAPKGDAARAFALFYTSVIGSGGLAPILYGAIADHSSRTIGVLSAATTALLIVPMALTLRRSLREQAVEKRS
jgi:MFS family permease